jgi:hypothetical protein
VRTLKFELIRSQSEAAITSLAHARRGVESLWYIRHSCTSLLEELAKLLSYEMCVSYKKAREHVAVPRTSPAFVREVQVECFMNCELMF